MVTRKRKRKRKFCESRSQKIVIVTEEIQVIKQDSSIKDEFRERISAEISSLRYFMMLIRYYFSHKIR